MAHRRSSRSVLALCALALAAGACAPRDGAPSSVPARQSFPAEQSLRGEVLGVDEVAPTEQLASSLRITLRPAGGRPLSIDLAPGWYLDEHGLRIQRRDTVEVVATGGGTTLTARRVTKDGRMLILRDAAGRPVWRDPR